MKHNITALITAAGFSSRMGAFKPLLLYYGKSFLVNIIDKLNPICDKIVVVTGYKASLIETELKSLPENDKIQTVFNNNFKDGMFSSLQVGLNNSLDSDWILYHFIDQPNLQTKFYEDLFSQIEDSFDWIQPQFDQKSGHPILLNKRMISIISSLSKTSNLKEISSQTDIRKKYWNCNHPEILNDVDTVDNYIKLIM
ncbi:MAG: NTP transferase domain-containing protein [Bacteroidetes bacterium]|nr:NTP transferase domain-containing protein [Bacteroidota bacterium]MBU1115572.1 NTP transferase domain-containing protein [Bacteroidota bacterium]MBU1799646.1 NTP transferase domain-containing protein [Bacteroidota bacterium]